MNMIITNNMAVPDASAQVPPPPSPQGVDPANSFAGANKSRMLKPVAQMETKEKTEKKEDQETRLNAKDTRELVEELNEYMDDLQTNLGFSFREELNHQVVVEIKNRETDELIKQIPSEELLIIREKMGELSSFIFDQSV